MTTRQLFNHLNVPNLQNIRQQLADQLATRRIDVNFQHDDRRELEAILREVENVLQSR